MCDQVSAAPANAEGEGEGEGEGGGESGVGGVGGELALLRRHTLRRAASTMGCSPNKARASAEIDGVTIIASACEW